jgi:hypothetical protein
MRLFIYVVYVEIIVKLCCFVAVFWNHTIKSFLKLSKKQLLHWHQKLIHKNMPPHNREGGVCDFNTDKLTYKSRRNLFEISKRYVYGTLQRTNAENWKQIFPEKELSSYISQFPHSCVCKQFIYFHNRSAYSAEGICGPILGVYKSLTDTRMWKLGLRPHNSQKRNT